jgi:uncharacterized membrane protein YccF (DUF307 family)
MKTIGNILWFVLAGIWLAIGYSIAGLVLCITIIGIPFGIQAFKLAGFVLWPFGRAVVPKPEALGVLDIIFNILWLLFFGWSCSAHRPGCSISLWFKLSLLALWPFGQTIVPSDDPQTFA